MRNFNNLITYKTIATMQHIFSKISKATLIALFAMISFNAWSVVTIYHDVVGDDGVTVLYSLRFTADETTLEATLEEKAESAADYTGIVTVPSEVIVGDVTYTVTAIGKKAFANRTGSERATKVTGVNLPATIKNIRTADPSAFQYCQGITFINVDAANEYYKSEDGIVFTIDGKTLVAYPGGKSGSSYTIPDGVENLAGKAFTDCINLVEVHLPGITELPDACFARCSNLSTLDAPDLTSIGSSALRGVNLTTFDLSQIESLDKQAFWESQITSITIPSQITEIPEKCFDACTKLDIVELHDEIVKIGDYAFRGTSKLTKITLPSSLVTLGKGAFMNSRLENVDIPSTLTTIPSEAFRANKLKSIVIPNSIESIGDLAFYNNNSVTYVVIGENVKSIGNGALNWNGDGTTIVVKSLEPPIINSSASGSINGVFYGNGVGYNIVVPCLADGTDVLSLYKATVSEGGWVKDDDHPYDLSLDVVEFSEKANLFTLTANATEGGSVSEVTSPGEECPEAGTDLLWSVSETPDENYKFSHWTSTTHTIEEPNVIQEGNTITFKNLVKDAEVTAVFVPTYSLTYYIPGEDGFISPIDMGRLAEGETITTPTDEQISRTWGINDESCDSVASYAYYTVSTELDATGAPVVSSYVRYQGTTMPGQDLIAVANLEKRKFDITVHVTYTEAAGERPTEFTITDVECETPLLDALEGHKPADTDCEQFGNWQLEGSDPTGAPGKRDIVETDLMPVGGTDVYVTATSKSYTIYFNLEGVRCEKTFDCHAFLSEPTLDDPCFASLDVDKDCKQIKWTWEHPRSSEVSVDFSDITSLTYVSAFIEPVANSEIEDKENIINSLSSVIISGNLVPREYTLTYIAQYPDGSQAVEATYTLKAGEGIIPTQGRPTNVKLTNDAGETTDGDEIYYGCWQFDGWQYERGLGEGEWMPCRNYTVYGQLSKQDRKVTLNVDGQPYDVQPEISTYCGETVELPELGADYTPWRLDGQDIESSTITVTDNITLEAKSLHTIVYSLQKVNRYDGVEENDGEPIRLASIDNQEFGDAVPDCVACTLEEYNDCYDKTASFLYNGAVLTTVPSSPKEIELVKKIYKDAHNITFDTNGDVTLSGNTTLGQIYCGASLADIAYPTVNANGCSESVVEEGRQWECQAEDGSWGDVPAEMPNHNITIRPKVQTKQVAVSFKIDDADYVPAEQVKFECGGRINVDELPNLNENCTDCYTAWEGLPEDGQMPKEGLTLTAKSRHDLTYTLVLKTIHGSEESFLTIGTIPNRGKLEFGVAVPPKEISEFGEQYTEGCYAKSGNGWRDGENRRVATIPTDYPTNLVPQTVELFDTITINAFDVIFKANDVVAKTIEKQVCGTEINLSQYLPKTDELNATLTDNCQKFDGQVWKLNGTDVTNETTVTIENSDVVVEISSVIKKGKIEFHVAVNDDKDENGLPYYRNDTELDDYIDCGTNISQYVADKETTLDPDGCFTFTSRSNWKHGDLTDIPSDATMTEAGYHVYLHSYIRNEVTITYMSEGSEYATRTAHCGEDLPKDVAKPISADPTKHFVDWDGLPTDGKYPSSDITVTAIFEDNANAEVLYHTFDVEGVESTVSESYMIGSTFVVKAVSTDGTGCTSYIGWKRTNDITAADITETQLQMVADGIDLYQFQKQKTFTVHYSGVEGVTIDASSNSSLKCGDKILPTYSIDNCYKPESLKWQYQAVGSTGWENLTAITMSADLDGITIRPVVEKRKYNIAFEPETGVELDGQTPITVGCGEEFNFPRITLEDCYQFTDNTLTWQYVQQSATGSTVDWTDAETLTSPLSADITTDIVARPVVEKKLFTINYIDNGDLINVTLKDDDRTQYTCDEKIDFPKGVKVDGCGDHDGWEYNIDGTTDWKRFTAMPAANITARPIYQVKTRKVEYYVDNVKAEEKDGECGQKLSEILEPKGEGYTAWLLNGKELTNNDDINTNNINNGPIRLDAYSLHTLTFTLNVNEVYNGSTTPLNQIVIRKENVQFATPIAEVTPKLSEFDDLTDDLDLSNSCYKDMTQFTVASGETPETVGSEDIRLVASIQIEANDVRFFADKKDASTNMVIFTAKEVLCTTDINADLYNADQATGKIKEYDGEHIDELNPWKFDGFNAYPNYESNAKAQLTYWLVENGEETEFLSEINPTEQTIGLTVNVSEMTGKPEMDACKNYTAWQVQTENGLADFTEVRVPDEGMKFYMTITDKDPAVLQYTLDGEAFSFLSDVSIPCGKTLSDYLTAVSDLEKPENTCREYASKEWNLTLNGEAIDPNYVVKSGDQITAALTTKQKQYTVHFNVEGYVFADVPVYCNETIPEPAQQPQGMTECQSLEWDWNFENRLTDNLVTNGEFTVNGQVTTKQHKLTVAYTHPTTNETVTLEDNIDCGDSYKSSLVAPQVEGYGLSWNLFGEEGLIEHPDYIMRDYDVLAIAVYDKPTVETITICQNDKENYPYCWNGLLYSETGVYPSYDEQNHHLSLLDLTVIEPVYSEFSMSVCANDNSWSWNNVRYDRSGDYVQTFTAKTTGCDSIVTLHLTINPVLESDTLVTICGKSYTWHGKTFYRSEFDSYTEQDFQDVLTSEQYGCDSIVTLNLVFDDEAPARDSLIIACNAFEYKYGDGHKEIFELTNTNKNGYDDFFRTDYLKSKDGQTCDTVVSVKIRIIGGGYYAKAVPNYVFPDGEEQIGTLYTWQEPTCENGNIWIVEAQETNPNYHFTQWDDSTTTNPRVVRVFTDTVIVANFVEAKPVSSVHNITFGSLNSDYGEVSAWIELEAFANEDRYVFDQWTGVEPNSSWYWVSNEPKERIDLDRNLILTAHFLDTYEPYNPGDKTGDDDNQGKGAVVTPTGRTVEPSIILFGDRSTRGDGTPQDPIASGLDETPIEGTIFVSDKTITVVGHEGFGMQVYSVVGQLIYDGTITSNTTVINVPAHNVYLVKIGTQIAKVIVK